MACSHLLDGQLLEVVRFCQAYRLLELTAVKSINQVVIWREVSCVCVTVHVLVDPQTVKVMSIQCELPQLCATILDAIILY